MIERASDVLNGTNMLRKDNPRWGIGNAIETIRVPGAHLCPGTPFGSIAAVNGVIVAALIGVPRRAGRRLFEMKDEEARWHRWQVTETLGGLSRQYRDPRFDEAKADESLNGERLWRPAALGGPDPSARPGTGASSSGCSPPSRAWPL
jgi:hypothetical protein